MRPTKISDRIRRASAGGSKVASSPQTAADSTQEPVEVFRYSMELISPMLGGGARDKNSGGGGFDAHHPIRATGIRAQLRQWWRACRAEAQPAPGRAQGSATRNSGLHDEETALFGGMRDGKPVPSRILLRVVVQEIRQGVVQLYENAQEAEPPRNRVLAVRRYIGYALSTRTPMLAAGSRFELQITCTKTDHAALLPALRAFANVGGLGARTRRGFGAVFCAELAYSESEARALTRSYRAEWPVLARRIELFDMPLDRAHHLLWKFRQAPGFGRAEKANGDPGESYWPEAASLRSRWIAQRQPIGGFVSCKDAGFCQDQANCRQAHNFGSCRQARVVHLPTTHRSWGVADCWNSPRHFEAPRAAFGLPLIIHLKGEAALPGEREGAMIKTPPALKETIAPGGSNGGRWASPLILRPLRLRVDPPGSEQWQERTAFLLLRSPEPAVGETKPVCGSAPRRAVLTAREFSARPADAPGADNCVAHYLRQADPPGDALQAFLDFAANEARGTPWPKT